MATPQRSSGPIDLSEGLCRIISRHPTLRHQLKEIYNATLEPGDDEQYSNRVHTRPGHSKGGSKGSRRMRPPRGCWTPAKGLSQALYRFREIKERKDTTGEAMRAFSGLVVRPNTQYTPDFTSNNQRASGAITEPSDSDAVSAFLNAI